MKHLTPVQLENYDDAYMLAQKANAMFDERRGIAIDIAVAVENEYGPEEYADTNRAFSAADEEFELYYKAASILMPARAAFEVSEPVEPFASETVWAAMSLEQQLKASQLRPMIAEHLKNYGVTAESLRVVMHESADGKKFFTLVHTGNGVDIGNHSKDYEKARSYSSVMSKENDNLFGVELNGRRYDVRKGMTSSAYEALVADSREQGVTLIDSEQAAKENGELWTTWTMLTGEDVAADGQVQLRYVHDGQVQRLVCPPSYSNGTLRIRPAVVIAQLEP